MMFKKISFFLVIILSLLFLSGCYGELEIIIDGPRGPSVIESRGDHLGVIVNQTDYTIRVHVESTDSGNRVGSAVLSPNEKAFMKLHEKRYRFEATKAYSGERIGPTSISIHVNAIKNDAVFNGEEYDWYVIFSRRTRTHP